MICLPVVAGSCFPAMKMLFGRLTRTEMEPAPTRAQTRLRTGAATVIQSQPLRVRLRERLPGRRRPSREIENKWIYAFYDLGGGSCQLEAEIYAVNDQHWQVNHRPDLSQANLTRRSQAGAVREGFVYLDVAYASPPHGLFFLLSPIQVTGDALRYLMRGRNHTVLNRRFVDEGADLYRPVTFDEKDSFVWAQAANLHYRRRLRRWQQWTGNSERQNKLFIATTLRNWIGEDDPGDVRDNLADGQPEAFIEAYEGGEQERRERAERAMRYLARWVKTSAHRAIEMSAQSGPHENDPEALAVGLLHWGNISQEVLATLPGRVFADELLEDGVHLPATHIFADDSQIPQDLIFGTFKGTWNASLDILSEFLAAKVKKLEEAASGGERSTAERVQRYLENLAIETELRGTYRFIHERQRSGRRLTAGLRGRRRSRIMRSYQRLARRAESEIPRYTEQAQTELALAGKYGGISYTARTVQRSVTLVLNLYAMCQAIEDYRNAFPDTRDKKLIGLVSASLDLVDFTLSVTESYRSKASLFGRAAGAVGGGIGFATGVIDMLDKEEAAVQAAMNNHDYDQAVGQSIAAAGAAMSALGGGIAVAEAITAGALFGGPVGLIVGLIGAALVVGGSLLAWWLTDNEYEVFASHCFFGEDQDVEVTYPEWSNNGGLSPRTDVDSQVKILFDLLSKFSVEFVATTRRQHALPHDIITGRGYKLTIRPGFYDEGSYRLNADVAVQYRSETGLAVEDLRLPDRQTRIQRDSEGRVVALIREWSREDLGLNDQFHRVQGQFRYTVKLIGGSGQDVWKPVRASGTIGGQTRSVWGQYEWNNVEIS